jgi:starch-binding outer membrane protein, SusD/RagB family
LQKSESLTTAVKQQLLGEAKFMRALFYFYLVNLFGDIPIAISTDAVTNTQLSRSSKADVYSLIITDLKDAKDLMSPNYPDATLLGNTGERVRPTKWAAVALLARVYLFTGDYANAEVEASTLLDNNSIFNLSILKNTFLKASLGNKEAIWQLQPTANSLNTVEGQMYVIPPTGPGSFNPVFISKFLLNSFEPGDQRALFGNWIDTTIYKKTSTTYDTVPYSFKYKVYASPSVTSAGSMTEYFMVLRLGEQFLIRAEARAQQNKITEAKSDLNAIRIRAGLPSTTATDQASLLTAILDERWHELFCEWGHRWLDLKRTNKIDAVMSVITPLKSSGAIQWRSYQQYYPINQNELNKAPNLTQTDGYQ